MNIKDKYYTPSIEEFHIGFEYEAKSGFMDGTVKTKEDFDKAIWYKTSMIVGESPYIYRSLTGKNSENGLIGIRVKYLNRSDIESLGWKMDSGDLDYILNQFQLELYNNKVNITASYGEEEIFSGYIKNKSELNKLMKQLNIKI